MVDGTADLDMDLYRWREDLDEIDELRDRLPSCEDTKSGRKKSAADGVREGAREDSGLAAAELPAADPSKSVDVEFTCPKAVVSESPMLGWACASSSSPVSLSTGEARPKLLVLRDLLRAIFINLCLAPPKMPCKFGEGCDSRGVLGRAGRVVAPLSLGRIVRIEPVPEMVVCVRSIEGRFVDFIRRPPCETVDMGESGCDSPPAKNSGTSLTSGLAVTL